MEYKYNTITLENVYKLFKEEKINIEDYQRKYIYNKDNKLKLINSIMNNYFIGNLFFRDLQKSNESYNCIDGHQRIKTIVLFLDNQFRINYNNKSIYFYELPDSIKNNILKYEILLCKYICSREEEEEMFILYNLHRN